MIEDKETIHDEKVIEKFMNEEKVIEDKETIHDEKVIEKFMNEEKAINQLLNEIAKDEDTDIYLKTTMTKIHL